MITIYEWIVTLNSCRVSLILKKRDSGLVQSALRRKR